jgi:hypothetical protein
VTELMLRRLSEGMSRVLEECLFYATVLNLRIVSGLHGANCDARYANWCDNRTSSQWAASQLRKLNPKSATWSHARHPRHCLLCFLAAEQLN